MLKNCENKGVFPLVSVAIITYNQRDFLIECIESVLSQDYPNIEIVVGDDGSTDGTKELLHDYAFRYPGKFVLCLSVENRGITANSNAVHHSCSGDYVAWIGGDDVMFPRKIFLQVEHMEKHPECAICYHDVEVFESASGERLYNFSERHRPRQGDVRVVVRWGTFNCGCSTMVRREMAPSHGFNSDIPMASDWIFWIETLATGGEIQYIDRILSRYRRHGGNITCNNSQLLTSTLKDHFITFGIVLMNNPELHVELRRRVADMLRGVARCHKGSYGKYIFASLGIGFTLKSMIAALLYGLTFGRLRI